MADLPKLSGVICPITTPFDAEYRVDEASYRKQIQRLMAAGVNGIFFGGSAGEGPLLTETEWVRGATIALDETNKHKGIIFGGVQDTSTPRVIQKIRRLKEIGYKAYVATPTYYIPSRSADEHLRLYGECRNAFPDMELIAYNIPGAVGVQISKDTMLELARRKWVRYCKESTDNPDHVVSLINDGKELGLGVFVGSEACMGMALWAGAVGLVALGVNNDPGAFVRGFQGAQKRDAKPVIELDMRCMDLRRYLAFTGECWLSGTKYYLSTLGLGSDRILPPLTPASDAQKKAIDAFMKR